MSWLKIQAGLVTNKKTARLAGQMKWKKLEAVGFLVSFWIWAIENCEEGLLRDISDSELAFAVGVENAEGILTALKNSGLVDINPLRIHDWPEHQGDYLRSKYRKSPERYAAIINQYRTSTVPVPYQYMSSTVPVPDRDRVNRVDIIKREKQHIQQAVGAADDKNKPVDWKMAKTAQQRLAAYYLQRYSPDIYNGNKEQVSAWFRRHGKALTDIVQQAGGDYNLAREAFDLCVEFFNKNNCNWLPDTVAKHIGDHLGKAKGRINATTGNK